MADMNVRSPLLRRERDGRSRQLDQSSPSSINKDPEATAEEIKMADTAVGERLKYNDYTTIDWLHDLVIATHAVRVASVQRTHNAHRSKTQAACVPSTIAKAHVTGSLPYSTMLLAGLLRRSSER